MLLRFCAVSKEGGRTRQQVSMMSVSKQATGSPENPPARVYPSHTILHALHHYAMHSSFVTIKKYMSRGRRLDTLEPSP